MEKIKLALDWTPNINHIGFFVAKEKGFYAERGLEVALLSPAEDDYAVTPAKKVEMKEADFALCPMESVLSYRTKADSFDLKAIAAVYQEDLSAIVCTQASGITAPKALDGKSYASYQARYEDEIVMQMIRNDGGHGDLQIGYPSKLGIWETLLKGEFDATWIFMNWEGIQASGQGVRLNSFTMHDYGIPYSYSPVIAGSDRIIRERAAAFRKFLEATKEGFLYAVAHATEAAKLLARHVADSDRDIDLEAAIQASADALGTADTWGKMNTAQVQQYLDWIYEKGLETKKVDPSELISNRLL